MAFTPKAWENFTRDGDHDKSRLNAGAMNDLESRIEQGIDALDEAIGEMLDEDTLAALAGTDGTPGEANKFVTSSDARLSDERDPTAHSHAQSDVTDLVSDLAAKADDSDLTAHKSATESVHGIADTADLIVEGDARLTDARTPKAHSHDQSDVTGLTAALGAKADDSDLTAHVEATENVHGITDTADIIMEGDSRLTDARTPTSHSHAISDVTNLESSLSGKADSEHGHEIADVDGLSTALSGKQPLDSDLTAIAALSTTEYGRGLLALANAAAARSEIGAAASSHSHAQSDITNLTTDLAGKAAASHTHDPEDIETTGATEGDVLTVDGSGDAVWAEASGGGGGPLTVKTWATGNRALEESDLGCLLVRTGGSGYLTFDGSFSVPVGAQIHVKCMSGSMDLEYEWADTITSPFFTAQIMGYGMVTLTKVAAGTWHMSGDVHNPN